MGAGIHRWWLDSAAYSKECDAWRRQEQIKIARAIVVSKGREVTKMRQIISGFAKLWKEVP